MMTLGTRIVSSVISVTNAAISRTTTPITSAYSHKRRGSAFACTTAEVPRVSELMRARSRKRARSSSPERDESAEQVLVEERDDALLVGVRVLAQRGRVTRPSDRSRARNGRRRPCRRARPSGDSGSAAEMIRCCAWLRSDPVGERRVGSGAALDHLERLEHDPHSATRLSSVVRVRLDVLVADRGGAVGHHGLHVVAAPRDVDRDVGAGGQPERADAPLLDVVALGEEVERRGGVLLGAPSRRSSPCPRCCRCRASRTRSTPYTWRSSIRAWLEPAHAVAAPAREHEDRRAVSSTDGPSPRARRRPRP